MRTSFRLLVVAAVAVGALVATPVPAPAISVTVDWNPADPLVSGLHARVVFGWTAGTNMLDVTFTNTSTCVTCAPILHVDQNVANPLISDANRIQLLTGVGFDLPGGLGIAGGTAEIGSDSTSVNFNPAGPAPPVTLGPGNDTSFEWAAGKDWLEPVVRFGHTVNLVDFVTAAAGPGATQFPGPNVDGPATIDGPQAGLVACSDCSPVDLGEEVGAVRNSVLFHLTLSGDLGSDTSWTREGVVFVFGTHDIIGTPEPDTVFLLGVGFALMGLGLAARRTSNSLFRRMKQK
ncbi:MAG: hypothetical protein HY613_05095 [Candidatus Rokubacteria bacterium]|nr:hypothetical protein [Candidatus Rokubacteria bacterium]